MTDEEKNEELEQRRDAIRSRVSAQIRLWMNRTGRDVAKLAKDAGISTSAIYMIMRCERGANLDLLVQLADAFGIPPAVLLMPVEN